LFGHRGLLRLLKESNSTQDSKGARCPAGRSRPGRGTNSPSSSRS